MSSSLLLKTYAVIMLGGALGTGARFWLSGFFSTHFGEVFPVGTIVVNITGCLVIGLVAGLTGPDGIFLTSPLIRNFVLIGILGGYTTFSSFSLQTLNLLNGGQWLYAGGNVLISVFFCLLATWVGLMAAANVNAR